MTSEYTQCSGIVTNCVVSSDYQIKTASLLASTDQLVTLFSKVMKRLVRANSGKLTRQNKKLQKQVQELITAAHKEAALIPTETVSCGDAIPSA
jgi:hypothetical protein